MNAYFLKETDLNDFVGKMMKSQKVIAPKAKKNKFVFDKLETPDEARLDYDVTILPPKKAFFPTTQCLLHFKANAFESCIKPEKQVLFGVHYYDVKAIDMLDEVFKADNEDNNYLANRVATTVVASNIQKPSERAFYASACTEREPKGHDAYLTKIGGGYVYEVLTGKGKDLLQYGNFNDTSSSQLEEAKKAKDKALNDCPNKLPASSKDISDKVRGAFTKTELWDKLAEDCFSCGSCNTVCPTCYCFDVQDEWNLDQVSGCRSRKWDACLTEDFAKVSLGAGAEENFREERSGRYRHRIMRKAAYLNEKLSGPACVGCGRCSTNCVPDIADPVKTITTIMEA